MQNILRDRIVFQPTDLREIDFYSPKGSDSLDAELYPLSFELARRFRLTPDSAAWIASFR
jgi:hypothetical protein